MHMQPKHIVVIEKQAHTADLLNNADLGARFSVTWRNSLKQKGTILKHEQTGLIILDLTAMDVDGQLLVRQIRKVSQCVPILLIHSSGSSGCMSDRDISLIDFLVSPFETEELIARVESLLQRAQTKQSKARQSRHSNWLDPKSIKFNNIVIDINQHKVETREGEIKLTAREFDLLVVLASAPGRVFRRERLLDAVWGQNHRGSAHTVNTHVNRLRTKIEANPAKPEYVKTVWGVGYKFNGQIRP